MMILNNISRGQYCFNDGSYCEVIGFPLWTNHFLKFLSCKLDLFFVGLK